MNDPRAAAPSRAIPSLLTAVWVACSLGFLACSSAPCDRASTVYAEVNTKLKDCPDYAQLTFDKATCSSNVKNCSSADQTTFDNAMDCLEQLPTCESGSESTWATQFQDCQSSYQVSTTCAAAVGNH